MDSKKFSPTIVSLQIFKLEEKYNLFNWKIDGVYIWELIRAKIFLKVLESSFNQKYNSTKFSFKEKMSIFARRFFLNSLIKNPFIKLRKKEILIFQSGRKYLVENSYKDMYTYFISAMLMEKGVKVETYNTNFLYDHYDNKTSHLDFILLASKFVSKIVFFKIGSKDYDLIKILENEIDRNFSIKLDLLTMIKKEIKDFKSKYPFYKFLLWMKKPSEIFIVNYLSFAPLIKAAKDRSILVKELQHGLLIEEYLLYHFPNVKVDSLNYFPDQFYLWKDFLYNTSKLPLSSQNLIANEYNHLSFMQKLYNLEKNGKQILISSQPFFSDLIVSFIIKNAPLMKEWAFYYKLHPLEIHSYDKSEMKKILEEFSNITVVKDECSIYQLLAKSSYVLGIYSTSLFEASYFKCKILILESPSNEMISSLIENVNVKLISSSRSLISQIH